jgi:hypothetical protein
MHSSFSLQFPFFSFFFSFESHQGVMKRRKENGNCKKKKRMRDRGSVGPAEDQIEDRLISPRSHSMATEKKNEKKVNVRPEKDLMANEGAHFLSFLLSAIEFIFFRK